MLQMCEGGGREIIYARIFLFQHKLTVSFAVQEYSCFDMSVCLFVYTIKLSTCEAVDMKGYTERELFSLIEKNKIDQESDFFTVISPGAQLKLEQKEVLRNVLKKFKKTKKTHFTSKKIKIDYEFLVNRGSADTVLTIEQGDNLSQSGDTEAAAVEASGDDMTPSRRKNWGEMTKRHQSRLVDPIIESINNLAIETATEPTDICSFLVKKYKIEEYSYKVLPTITAAAIISASKKGQRNPFDLLARLQISPEEKKITRW